jgi:hypothetical protein
MTESLTPREMCVKQTGNERGLDQLYEILTELVARAELQATHRCPYRNRVDECTAGFGCRNQLRVSESAGRPACAGDDKLDYRPAWEVSGLAGPHI